MLSDTKVDAQGVLKSTLFIVENVVADDNDVSNDVLKFLSKIPASHFAKHSWMIFDPSFERPGPNVIKLFCP
jgi:hypothetical protein